MNNVFGPAKQTFPEPATIEQDEVFRVPPANLGLTPLTNLFGFVSKPFIILALTEKMSF
jgi:hypothetical protein